MTHQQTGLMEAVRFLKKHTTLSGFLTGGVKAGDLGRLDDLGLIEPCRIGFNWCYRITEAGRTALAEGGE